MIDFFSFEDNMLLSFVDEDFLWVYEDLEYFFIEIDSFDDSYN